VCFAGSFGRTYDLAPVIDAARQLQGISGWNGQIAICGGGERDKVWRDAALGIEGIGFMGWLSAGELSFMLSKSVAGLAAYAPNAPQGIPNKVIEYLAYGLPIISSLRGESCELLEAENCGVYFDPNESGQLAESMVELLSDEIALRSMAESALNIFNRRFSARSVYSDLADHLEFIMQSN
jgi:glycosyltransferase involved in cell wall biosynthesis